MIIDNFVCWGLGRLRCLGFWSSRIQPNTFFILLIDKWVLGEVRKSIQDYNNFVDFNRRNQKYKYQNHQILLNNYYVHVIHVISFCSCVWCLCPTGKWTTSPLLQYNCIFNANLNSWIRRRFCRVRIGLH
jgi:hypothetical protein